MTVENGRSARRRLGSVLLGYGLQVHRNKLLAMLGAFDDVQRRFLAANRVNELFNRGANELRITPAPIRRALEFRLFGEFHPGLQQRIHPRLFQPTTPENANRSEDDPGVVNASLRRAFGAVRCQSYVAEGLALT